MDASKELSMDGIVSAAWHWRVKDGMSWAFCAGIIKQNYGIDISAIEVKDGFVRFFKYTTGYKVYSKCPSCGTGKIVPQKSQYGYFVSCSTFPKCNFKGTSVNKVEADKI